VDIAGANKRPVCFFSVDLFVQQKEKWAMIQHGLTSTIHPVCGMEEPLRG